MRHGSRARLSIALALLIASVGCAPGADRSPSSAASTPAPTSAAAVPTEAKPAAAPANPDAAAPKPASSAAAGRPNGEISYWAFGDAEELAIFEAVVEGYRRHNADVTVKLNIVPNQNEFMTKLSASLTLAVRRPAVARAEPRCQRRNRRTERCCLFSRRSGAPSGTPGRS